MKGKKLTEEVFVNARSTRELEVLKEKPTSRRSTKTRSISMGGFAKELKMGGGGMLEGAKHLTYEGGSHTYRFAQRFMVRLEKNQGEERGV